MIITDLIVWGQNHWKELVDVVAYTVATASIVVKLTPTLKDDNILKGVVKFIGKYIALNK